MTLILNIPNDLSEDLNAKYDDLGRAALEALAAEAYEQDVLSLEQVRRLLGLESCWDAQAVLARHKVWPGTTVQDLESDFITLEKIPAAS
jgi:Uncharacterised protein family (UPF0175)